MITWILWRPTQIYQFNKSYPQDSTRKSLTIPFWIVDFYGKDVSESHSYPYIEKYIDAIEL